MKREIAIGSVVSLFFLILLLVFSPDILSLIFMLIMSALYVLGYIFGVIRLYRFNEALCYGRRSIQLARKVETESAWTALKGEECIFGDADLDDEFKNYTQRMEKLGERGSMIISVEEYVNEDFFSSHARHNLISQLPGTLTSLGVLGTFLGLILGISGMGFSSLNLAIESIETLLTGIELAFYTSIAGVILAIVFNLTYHVISERNNRELKSFLKDFHRYILPTKEDALLEHQLNFMELMTCKTNESIEQGVDENEI